MTKNKKEFHNNAQFFTLLLLYKMSGKWTSEKYLYIQFCAGKKR